MREFILYSRKGQTNANFSNLHDAGRLDVVHECIITSLFLSHKLRRNVVLDVILNGPPTPPIHLRLDGRILYDVRTDSGTWENILRKVLSAKVHPGISVRKASFEAVLKEKVASHSIYVLEEGGKSVDDVDIGDSSVFVLGDHIGLPKTVETFVLRYGEKVSLGKQAYLAASCLTILNFIMDKRRVHQETIQTGF